jgi:hypothetical protein
MEAIIISYRTLLDHVRRRGRAHTTPPRGVHLSGGAGRAVIIAAIMPTSRRGKGKRLACLLRPRSPDWWAAASAPAGEWRPHELSEHACALHYCSVV